MDFQEKVVLRRQFAKAIQDQDAKLALVTASKYLEKKRLKAKCENLTIYVELLEHPERTPPPPSPPPTPNVIPAPLPTPVPLQTPAPITIPATSTLLAASPEPEAVDKVDKGKGKEKEVDTEQELIEEIVDILTTRNAREGELGKASQISEFRKDVPKLVEDTRSNLSWKGIVESAKAVQHYDTLEGKARRPWGSNPAGGQPLFKIYNGLQTFYQRDGWLESLIFNSAEMKEKLQSVGNMQIFADQSPALELLEKYADVDSSLKGAKNVIQFIRLCVALKGSLLWYGELKQGEGVTCAQRKKMKNLLSMFKNIYILVYGIQVGSIEEGNLSSLPGIGLHILASPTLNPTFVRNLSNDTVRKMVAIKSHVDRARLFFPPNTHESLNNFISQSTGLPLHNSPFHQDWINLANVKEYLSDETVDDDDDGENNVPSPNTDNDDTEMDEPFEGSSSGSGVPKDPAVPVQDVETIIENPKKRSATNDEPRPPPKKPKTSITDAEWVEYAQMKNIDLSAQYRESDDEGKYPCEVSLDCKIRPQSTISAIRMHEYFKCPKEKVALRNERKEEFKNWQSLKKNSVVPLV